MFKYNVLKPYLEGQFEGVADADKIHSAKSYMQSIKVYFELSLKDNISEFFLNSELPRDTHRNKFFFYPRYLFMGFMVCFFQGLILLQIVLLFVQKSFWILPTIIYYQCLLLKCYRNGYRFMYPKMDVMQAIKFLAIITNVSPGKDLDKWDQIAQYMNQYLVTEEDNGHSKNIFFDGKHCLDCYKACFEPLSLGNNSLSYDELKEIVEITQPSLNEETD